MSINRWMDKVVVNIRNGILLSHKKEHIWISSNEVDELKTDYTEWSESERERYTLYPNTYIQNLEKWHWRIYLQGHSGETNIENRLMDMRRGEERVRCMKRVTWKHLTICKIDSQWEFAVWLRKFKQGLCINLEGCVRDGDGREFKKGGDICKPMAGSCWGLTENSKSL